MTDNQLDADFFDRLDNNQKTNDEAVIEEAREELWLMQEEFEEQKAERHAANT